MSDEDYAAICQRIGAVVLCWAHAENALDLCLAIFVRDFPLINAKKPFPVSLSRKLDLFEKALDSIKALERIQADGHSLHKRFMALKEHRHNVVHGIAWQALGDTLGMARMLVVNGNPVFATGRQEVGNVNALIAEVGQLMDEAVHFFFMVSGMFPDPPGGQVIQRKAREQEP